MDYNQIENPVVKAAFIAWNNGHRNHFLQLISDDTTFIHNGESGNIVAFSDEFFFGPNKTLFTEILRTENAGQTVYATLESAAIGRAEVLMRFKIVAGKIVELDAGRP